MKSNAYIYTAHARERMRERKISAEEVRLVLNPDVSYPGTKGDMNYLKTIKRRDIRIVVFGEEPKKIITVMIVGQAGEAK